MPRRPSLPTFVLSLLLFAPAAARAEEPSVEEVRRLLPEAMGLDAVNWRQITRAPNPPTVASYRSFGLTTLFMLERWIHDPNMGPGLRFLTPSTPSPAQLAPAFERSLARGFVSFVQAEDLSEVRLAAEGDGVRGTCRFRVEGLYEGGLRFRLGRTADGWVAERVDLPALGLRTVRVDGTWRGSLGVLNRGRVGAELAVAFAPRVDRATVARWRPPGARPTLRALADANPGTALFARLDPPGPPARWRFLGGEAPPSVDRLESLLVARSRGGAPSFVRPSEVVEVAIEAGEDRGEELEASAEVRDARGTFALRVEELLEGAGRFEARFFTPEGLPPGLEGGWLVRVIDLPGLGVRFELDDDLQRWRAIEATPNGR